MFRSGWVSLAVVVLCSASLGQASRPCQPPVLQTPAAGLNIFNDQQESDLGDAIAEQLQRNFRVINDDTITLHLTRIGQRIIRHIPPSTLRFQFFLVDLPEANAFTLPGGRIYVSRKLVAFAQSEDELAGVLAHELGHLLAHQGAIQMSKALRQLLGVTAVGDRRDIFEKYNMLVDNAARKPNVFDRGNEKEEGDQLVADQIGLFAVASAGYNPEASARFFDRVTENKGRKGSFFSDLFGATNPETKRYREMIKAVASMPASCIEPRVSEDPDEFRKWQTAVINYTGAGRREALHAVLKKSTLEPPLRSDITHLRFSPNGKFLLAQDDAGINVLSVQPFASLFRIDAPEAKHAHFTPDSQEIVFSNADLRVQAWDVREQKIKNAYEVFARKGCLQSVLSPSGRVMACLDPELSLNLYDVATGTQIFQKKEFYLPNPIEMILVRLASLFNEEGQDIEEVDWINMAFSPDEHYFAAGARSTGVGVTEDSIRFFREDNAIAIDLTTRQPVSLRGPLKKLIAGGFVFLGPDRLIGIDRHDAKKSGIVSFPGGEVIEQTLLGGRTLAAATHGNYVVARPIQNFPAGVVDLNSKKIIIASKVSPLDVYDQLFVAERTNGEIGLYATETREVRAVLTLPKSPLGRLRSSALSDDLNWLAVSQRSRGAIWNIAKGERAYLVRGFRGGYFADDNAFYADFPRFEQDERGIGRLDLTRRDVTRGADLTDSHATQHGRFFVALKPAKNDGGFDKNVNLELRDVKNYSVVWSRNFPKEAPRVWMSSHQPLMVLTWPVATAAAQAEIKSDPALAKQLAALKEKEGDYFVQVLDSQTGKLAGRLLIETGKGSFRITQAFATADSVVVSDNQNRTLVYSLSTGEQRGKIFGTGASVAPASKLLCLENEPGRLSVYSFTSLEKLDEFTFSSPVSLTRFSGDGTMLFVLTADQTVYHLDVSSLIR